jgi:hypothetical protein
MPLILASIPAAVCFYTVRAQFKNERGNRFADTQHAHYQEVCASMAAFNSAYQNCAGDSVGRQLLDLSSQVSATRALPPKRVLSAVTNLADIVLRSVTNDVNVPTTGEAVAVDVWKGSLVSTNDIKNPSNTVFLKSETNDVNVPRTGEAVATDVRKGSLGGTNDTKNPSSATVQIIATEYAKTGTIIENVQSYYVTTKPVVIKPGERDVALADAYTQKLYATRLALMAARPYFSKKVQNHIDEILTISVDPCRTVPKSAFSNEFDAAVVSDDLTELIHKVQVEHGRMIEAQGYLASQAKLLAEMEAELVIRNK